MLQINNIFYKKDSVLDIFFEKPSAAFHLREISRLSKVSTTAAKAKLTELEKIGLVTSERKANLVIYRAVMTEEYKEAKKLYNIRKIRESKIINCIIREMRPEAIILFGSASRGENSEKSDIDLFVLANVKGIDVSEFEKKLSKKINMMVMTRKEFEEAKKKSPEFINNVINGIRLEGYLRFL